MFLLLDLFKIIPFALRDNLGLALSLRARNNDDIGTTNLHKHTALEHLRFEMK